MHVMYAFNKCAPCPQWKTMYFIIPQRISKTPHNNNNNNNNVIYYTLCYICVYMA